MGCGKTWLSTTIGHTLRREAKPKDRIAICYFSNASATISTQAVMYSLISQLGMREKIHPALHTLSERLKKTQSVDKPSTQQLQATLLEVLQPIDSEGATFILVDALDEVPFHNRHSERASVAKFLNTLASSQAPTPRVLMTSRPHEDLLRIFGDPQAGWAVFPIPADNNQADVKLYVRAAVKELAMEYGVNENSQERLIARLAGPKQTM